MHYVGEVDWSFAAEVSADAGDATANTSGLARSVLVGPHTGAVHTDLAVGVLAPGGWIKRHVHSFEEALYVLSGELILELDGHTYRLRAGDFADINIGLWHALGNTSGQEVRWLALNSPQRLSPDSGRKDTFYVGGPMNLEHLASAAQPPAFGDPTLRHVGHYEGTPPQLEALRVADPARGRRPQGMDTAILAYSGISVKMMVDRVGGADMVTMFTVDYETGGAAQPHDHPFEEAYFFLTGEVEAELDGKAYTLHPGNVVFAGVGSVHAFYNVGKERVRWIETQAPQPPARHSYRWVDHWKRFENEVGR